jgi:hypothetical protein
VGDENVLELNRGSGHVALLIHKKTLNSTFVGLGFIVTFTEVLTIYLS